MSGVGRPRRSDGHRRGAPSCVAAAVPSTSRQHRLHRAAAQVPSWCPRTRRRRRARGRPGRRRRGWGECVVADRRRRDRRAAERCASPRIVIFLSIDGFVGEAVDMTQPHRAEGEVERRACARRKSSRARGTRWWACASIAVLHSSPPMCDALNVVTRERRHASAGCETATVCPCGRIVVASDGVQSALEAGDHRAWRGGATRRCVAARERRAAGPRAPARLADNRACPRRRAPVLSVGDARTCSRVERPSPRPTAFCSRARRPAPAEWSDVMHGTSEARAIPESAVGSPAHALRARGSSPRSTPIVAGRRRAAASIVAVSAIVATLAKQRRTLRLRVERRRRRFPLPLGYSGTCRRNGTR